MKRKNCKDFREYSSLTMILKAVTIEKREEEYIYNHIFRCWIFFLLLLLVLLLLLFYINCKSSLRTIYWTCLVNLILMFVSFVLIMNVYEINVKESSLCSKNILLFSSSWKRRRVSDEELLTRERAKGSEREREGARESKSNNRTVTHMSPDDDEEESSVTFLNPIFFVD